MKKKPSYQQYPDKKSGRCGIPKGMENKFIGQKGVDTQKRPKTGNKSTKSPSQGCASIKKTGGKGDRGGGAVQG